MTLTDQQQRQFDALASLLTTPDRASITQGVELATALGDQEVFARLLEGVTPVAPDPTRRQHQRYSSPKSGPVFTNKRIQPWLDLSMLHLLAASELTMREEVTSISLRAPKSKQQRAHLWLDGFERFTFLTHLDLHLSADIDGFDLGVLASFPSLTHLRLRGRSNARVLPGLEHLEVFDGSDIEFADGAVFPALRSFSGRLQGGTQLTPEVMPQLVDVKTHGAVRVAGFRTLRRFMCTRGEVELRDCEQVGELDVSGPSFDAPELRHIGTLERVGSNIDVSQFESIGTVRMDRTSRFSGGLFPDGTKLLRPKVVLWGPMVEDLGNLGELPGLEELHMPRVKHRLSLEPLRHALSLRILDIRNSPGITDLTPLIGLPKLELVVLSDRDIVPIPDELADVVNKQLPARRAV